mgnify:CR=1 FL=1
MEALIRTRPYAIAVFFIALAGVFASAVANATWLFMPAGSLAHVALLLFVTTESFGPIAERRSRASRWGARIFFALLALLVTTLVVGFLLDLLA